MSKEQDADYRPQPKVIENPEWNGKDFDLRVTIKDGKTGEIIRHQPYNRHCIGAMTYYERPIGSGNLFFGDGKVAGRIFKNPDWKKGSKVMEFVVDEELTHVDFEVPEMRKFSHEAAQEVADENAELKRELAQLKAEKSAKMAEQKPEAKQAGKQ